MVVAFIIQQNKKYLCKKNDITCYAKRQYSVPYTAVASATR